MRSSLSRSWLSLAAWFYIGPFVVVCSLALLVLGFGVLAMAIQMAAALLKQVGI
jgi:hypothetical protein